MEQRLERTLSGLTKDERTATAAAAAKKASTKIDDLLTRTLSGLDMPKKPTKPPASVAPPAPAAATAPAPLPSPPSVEPRRPLAPAPPADRSDRSDRSGAASACRDTRACPCGRTRIAAVFGSRADRRRRGSRPGRLRVGAPAGLKPPGGPLAPPAKAPEPSAPTRRQSREIDLAQLDELAKPRAKESVSTPRPTAKESFATQKIAVSPSFLQPPSSEFGQYTLLERIAVGGMAEVWKARMKGVEGFQKTVAIKKILPHLTDSSDFVTMFIDEAKLAAQLNHNNIIHIYDLGKIGDDYFIAMEFVDGKDLRSILNSARAESRPLPLGLALLVGSRLSSALDHAHRQRDFEGRPLGLVHRDVSPQNVLISYEGDIKLCDFGIVKAVTKASKTQMGALKGKLQYMSPEQAWGRPVDARSDIFSLGSLLFEMLTGRRLFSGESEMSVLDAVREGRIQAPRDLDPRLPLEVNALVLKALARDPGDRFLSAGEMQREIDGILVSLKPAPTQADLGAYLHQLFAAEAQAGTPSTFAAPTAATPAIAARTPAVTPSAAVPGRQAEVAVVAPTGVSRIEEPDAGRSRNMLWLAIGGVAAAGLVAYLAFGRGATTAPPAEPAATGAVAAVGSESAAAPEAGTAAGAAPDRGCGIDACRAWRDDSCRRAERRPVGQRRSQAPRGGAQEEVRGRVGAAQGRARQAEHQAADGRGCDCTGASASGDRACAAAGAGGPGRGGSAADRRPSHRGGACRRGSAGRDAGSSPGADGQGRRPRHSWRRREAASSCQSHQTRVSCDGSTPESGRDGSRVPAGRRDWPSRRDAPR